MPDDLREPPEVPEAPDHRSRDRHLAALTILTYGNGKEVEVWGDRGRVALTFRGTYRPDEWISNLLTLPEVHPVLGPVHAGFFAIACRLAGEALNLAQDRPIVLAGHSRGGAIAILVGALLKLAGHPPVEIVTFGAPKAGYAPLRRYLADVEVRQYRKGSDPFTEWPDPPYEHIRPLQGLLGQLDLFGDHDLLGYVEALREAHSLAS